MGERFKRYAPIKGESSRVYNGKAHIDALYKGDWAKYSKEFLSVNKRCYSCGGASEATDHLRVHLGDKELFYAKDNHIPLCHRCHNTITGKFDRKIPQDLEGKMKWLFANRQRNDLSFAVKVIDFKFSEIAYDLRDKMRQNLDDLGEGDKNA